MRKTIVLLQLMYDNLEKGFKYPGTDGLCLLNLRLERNILITNAEYKRMEEYLKTNLPDVPYYVHDGYCWPRNEVEPRIKWLKKQIDELQKRKKKRHALDKH